MALLFEQILRAKERAQGTDLHALVAYARNKTPAELGTPKQLAERKQFIEGSLGKTPQSRALFERLIAGNELQAVNYLARGARAARAVSRVSIREGTGRTLGYGTGFLIAPRVLITNNHVLPGPSTAAASEAQFEYEADIDGTLLPAVAFRLLPGELFFTSVELDFTVVAVAPSANEQGVRLGQYGCLPLVGTTGKAADGEWLTIVQHPGGDRKQVCVRENKLLKRDKDVLWYSTDTLGGSSGSPVFNNDWYVVALHHSGVPEERDGRIQTLNGQDYDPQRHGEQDIKWVANEGIRVSRIVETLQSALPTHELLTPIFRATPESARILPDSVDKLRNTSAGSSTSAPRPNVSQSNHQQEVPVSDSFGGTRTVTVTLQIEDDGQARVVSTGSARESFAFQEAAKESKKAPMDVEFDYDYAGRAGYKSDFLGANYVVELPKLSPALEQVAAKLISMKGVTGATANDRFVLKYHNYSVVVNKERRLAIYSAANVDFSGRYDLARPADVWREDQRIAQKEQLGAFYYKNNKFDRGHLTRREDLEFGSTLKKALQSAADTCHWPNCTPQHSQFNQNKQLWQGIERHLLEEAIERNEFRAQVFTGPVLAEDDPVWERFKDIQYPVMFWKVVAAVSSRNELFATAYLLDQSEVLAKYGIEAAPEVPFSPYKTFQVSIRHVEELTGLTFLTGNNKSLADFDPLNKIGPRRGPGRGPSGLRAKESMLAERAQEGMWELESLEDIFVR